MDKVNRYEFEGEVIEVPVRWDDHLQREAEDYDGLLRAAGLHPGWPPHSFDH